MISLGVNASTFKVSVWLCVRVRAVKHGFPSLSSEADGRWGGQILAAQQRHSSDEDCLCASMGGVIEAKTNSAGFALSLRAQRLTPSHSCYSFLPTLFCDRYINKQHRPVLRNYPNFTG